MDAGTGSSPPEDAAIGRGTVLDRYTVEGVLGEGGMAVVYRVRHNDLGSQHALKVLRIHSKTIRERLRAEGRAQARLRHVNIVSVTDLIDVSGAPGLVMELIEGPSLDRRLAKGPLTLDEIDSLAVGLLDGVRAAHSAGLIHRDLKPGNVLLADTDRGVVAKITDFGLVKAVLPEPGAKVRTRAGSTMGTPAYMAPEQVRDAASVDARADLFSLGVILFELVTGLSPFLSDDLMESFNRVIKGDFPHPRSLRPDLPPRMERAILAAMVVDRDQRVDSADALRDLWTGRVPAWRDGQPASGQAGPWTAGDAPRPPNTMFFPQSVPAAQEVGTLAPVERAEVAPAPVSVPPSGDAGRRVGALGVVALVVAAAVVFWPDPPAPAPAPAAVVSPVPSVQRPTASTHAKQNCVAWWRSTSARLAPRRSKERWSAVVFPPYSRLFEISDAVIPGATIGLSLERTSTGTSGLAPPWNTRPGCAKSLHAITSTH